MSDTPARPWQHGDTSLALNIGDRNPGDNTSSIAWAVLKTARERVIDSGEIRFQGDPVAATIKRWIEAGRPSPVALWTYTEKTFPLSVPFSEGMTLAEHRNTIDRTAKALQGEGAQVILKKFKPGVV